MVRAISSSLLCLRGACCHDVGATLASPVGERVQLCGAMVIERDGRRWEALLPGRQGRLLFAYLTLNRHRTCSRDELTGALWGDHIPQAGDTGLNALLS